MSKTKRTSTITPEQIIKARGNRTKQAIADLLGINRYQYRKYEQGLVAMTERQFAMMAK